MRNIIKQLDKKYNRTDIIFGSIAYLCYLLCSAFICGELVKWLADIGLVLAVAGGTIAIILPVVIIIRLADYGKPENIN